MHTAGQRPTLQAFTSLTQVAIPSLGPLLGMRNIGGADSPQPSLAVAPPWAFGIWGPIFGASIVHSLREMKLNRRLPATRSFTVAMAGNCAWMLATQAGAYSSTPYILLATTGAAHRALSMHRRSTGTSLGAAASGSLAGWTTLALLLNVDSEATRRGVNLQEPRNLELVEAAVLGASTVGAVRSFSSGRGGWAVASATVWGLVAVSYGTPHPRIRQACSAGAIAVAAAGVFGWLRGLRRRKTHE